MTIYRSTIQLLRIPFSINLLPIFLFAVYAALDHLIFWKAALVFILIHFIFYPASNAYNSYMDKDEGAIAGLERPPEATKQLYYVSIILDILGLSLSLLVSLPFAFINLILVLLSRAYSWRGIRLKKYAVIGFLMVALAQGGTSFYNMYLGLGGLDYFPTITWELALNITVATLFVGAIYPITQIYQHEDDARDGVRTISMLLGIRGTFIFSGFLFLVANVLLFATLTLTEFFLFEIMMIFPVGYFLYWTWITWNDFGSANFKHTMVMALSASIGMIVGFSIILGMKFF